MHLLARLPRTTAYLPGSAARLTVIAILLVAHAARLGAADRLVLKNGDTLSGTVASASSREVILDSPLVGRVIVPWSAITDFISETTMRVALANTSTTEGRLLMSAGQLTVRGSTGSMLAVRTDEIRQATRAEASRPASPWHGALSADVNVSQGNSVTSTIGTNALATRLGARDKLGLFGTYLFSSVGAGDSATTTTRATRAGSRYDHDLGARLFGFGLVDVENDPLQLLDWRLVGGGGAGAHLVKHALTQLNIVGGVSYARDAYAETTETVVTTSTPSPTTPVTPGQGSTPPGKGGTPPGQTVRLGRSGTPPAIVRTALSRSVGEFLIGQDLFHQLSSSLNVTESLRVFPAISQFSDYRMSFDLSLSAQIAGRVQWNMTVADRYLHIPPAGGAVQNDTFISTGLGITFGKSGVGTFTGADRPDGRGPR